LIHVIELATNAACRPWRCISRRECVFWPAPAGRSQSPDETAWLRWYIVCLMWCNYHYLSGDLYWVCYIKAILPGSPFKPFPLVTGFTVSLSFSNR